MTADSPSRSTAWSILAASGNLIAAENASLSVGILNAGGRHLRLFGTNFDLASASMVDSGNDRSQRRHIFGGCRRHSRSAPATGSCRRTPRASFVLQAIRWRLRPEASSTTERSTRRSDGVSGGTVDIYRIVIVRIRLHFSFRAGPMPAIEHGPGTWRPALSGNVAFDPNFGELLVDAERHLQRHGGSAFDNDSDTDRHGRCRQCRERASFSGGELTLTITAAARARWQTVTIESGRFGSMNYGSAICSA